MSKELTLGSLFDGSGGFPLAGALNGIKPVWASEIEPYPLKVTAARFPDMIQLGDITKMDGTVIPPVDIICGGSPCQDLSQAGNRQGIVEGDRSSLFFEMIRVIKEMRETTHGKYPKYVVWENVLGALSSNKGQDFRIVLESFCRLADETASIPMPKKWGRAGCIVGDGYSLAWRVYDAQYWGVPQRRKRVYLVLSLGNERAGEVLFEPESCGWNPQTCGETGKGTATHTEGSIGGSLGVKCLNPWDYQSIRQYDVNGVFPTLSSMETSGLNRQGVCMAAGFKTNQGAKANGIGWSEETSCTLSSNVAGFEPAVVYDARGNGDGKIVPTLTGDHQNRVTDYTALCVGNGQMCNISMAPVSNTLDCMHDQQAILLEGKPPRKYIVRRLTPLECCRLQGFPDNYEDGSRGSDTARFRMWGNGIALPCAYDALRKVVEDANQSNKHL